MTWRVPSRPPAGLDREQGSTLIEVLLALVITSSAVFVLVGGMSAIFANSVQNRQTTTSGVVARDYAESLEVTVAEASANAVAGAWCATSYTTAYSPPTGYSVASVPGACPAISATVPQFQTVLITATGPNGATEQLRVVVREA